MTTPKSLPARPSLDSLRKQAKKLARRVAGGDAEAVGRARTQLPDAELPLSLRDAQLVLAREYGYAGWPELIAGVHERLGNDLEWAAARARHLIHDNDVERLKQLLADHPALLSWRGEDDEGGLLGVATSSFGDSFDSIREEQYTRPACAELLIDAGAVAVPSVCESLIESRARGLLRLFQRKGAPSLGTLCEHQCPRRASCRVRAAAALVESARYASVLEEAARLIRSASGATSACRSSFRGNRCHTSPPRSLASIVFANDHRTHTGRSRLLVFRPIAYFPKARRKHRSASLSTFRRAGARGLLLRG